MFLDECKFLMLAIPDSGRLEIDPDNLIRYLC